MKEQNFMDQFDYITDSLQCEEDRLMVSTALIEPDFLNSACVGQEFDLVGYLIREVEVGDKLMTGCILFDEDGQSYSTVSAGVAKVVKSWADVGFEPSWDKPVRVKYEQVRKGTYSYYTVRQVRGHKK